MTQSTKKKVKFIGTQEYINKDTGEIVEATVTSVEERDFNFTKVWMRNFIATLDIVGNQKTKLCFWIVDHVDKNNRLIGTYRSIAQDSGISLDTVSKTMKILLDADFLRREQNGVHIINPDIIFKGQHAARMNIMNEYSSAERVEMTDEEKLNNLLESISVLQKKADVLQQKMKKNKSKTKTA